MARRRAIGAKVVAKGRDAAEERAKGRVGASDKHRRRKRLNPLLKVLGANPKNPRSQNLPNDPKVLQKRGRTWSNPNG